MQNMAIYRVNKKYFIIMKSLYTLYCITNRGISGKKCFVMDSVTVRIIQKYIYMYNMISKAKTCNLTNQQYMDQYNKLKSIKGNYLGEK